MQTLAELKALNAASEQAAATAEVVETAEAEVVDDVETKDVKEPQGTEALEGEAESTDLEDWAKPEGSVPVKTHVDMKHKLKGKLQDVNAENEQLKARLAALESGQVAAKPQQEQMLEVPMESDPDIDYDPQKYRQRMAEYHRAVVKQELSERDQKQNTQSTQRQHEERVQGEVDKHYERAAGLVDSKKVTFENYQAADHNVRKAVALALPGMGEYVLDNLIAELGEGSEKVMYHLGVNPAALAQLTDSLKSSTTGFKASAYLGGLNVKLNSAQPNKLSNAPKPDKVLNGTAKVSSGTDHKAYLKASNEGNAQAMLTLKRAAKARGVDTSTW